MLYLYIRDKNNNNNNKNNKTMNQTNYSIISKFDRMDDSEKIMYIVEKVFKATTPETAVTMEQIVNKGIEMGITEDYPRGRKDGHPWWPHTSVMMGVGNPDAVANWEEYSLHRKKMHKKNGGTVMCYWVDGTKRHEHVTRKSKSAGVNSNHQASKTPIFLGSGPKMPITDTEKMQKMMADYPGVYVPLRGKLYQIRFVLDHPDKFCLAEVEFARMSMDNN